jgi:hypothetical protein
VPMPCGVRGGMTTPGIRGCTVPPAPLVVPEPPVLPEPPEPPEPPVPPVPEGGAGAGPPGPGRGDEVRVATVVVTVDTS